MLTVMQAVESELEFAEGEAVAVSESGGQRLIDFMVRFRDQAALLEIKYEIPGLPEAYGRLLSQLNAAAGSGTAQQVVLVLVRPATAAQISRLATALGPNAPKIATLSVEEIYPWLKLFFGVSF